MEKFTVKTPDDLMVVVDSVLGVENQESSVVITLTGDLGAGKTTFVQKLAERLGVVEKVVSPTFGIMRVYEIEHDNFDRLVHIDAYRIEDISETEPLRFKELFQEPRKLICIEWPENIHSILPTNTFKIEIEITAQDERTVTVGK